MEPWQTIVKAAILGTERSPAAPAAVGGAMQGVLDGIARQTADDPQAALLATAAVLDGCRRAGRQIEQRPMALTPCEDAAQPLCSRSAAVLLARMLGGEHAEVLEEFMAALTRTGQLAPPEYVPALLEAGRSRRALREVVAAAVGRRGSWLASLNPSWSYLAGGHDEDDWETAAQPLRPAMLRRRRATDPAAGLAMLQKTWAEEPPEARAEFVAALEVGLSAADEAFLEQALDDRRKEVRTAAAELLSRMAGSALCGRAVARVAPLVTFNAAQKGSLLALKRGRKAAVVVTLPAECDKAMARDGIEAKVPAGRRGKIGEKAWWLVQMLGRVPPGHWLGLWSTDAATVIEASLAGEQWTDALMEAWCEAACRHRDAAWAEALLTTGRTWTVSAPGDLAGRLVAALPPRDRERVILDLMGGGKGFGKCSLNLLRGCDHPWSDALAARVVAAAEGMAVKAESFAMVEEIARRVPPSHVGRMVAVLGRHADEAATYLQKPLRDLMALCQFRHDALASVAS